MASKFDTWWQKIRSGLSWLWQKIKQHPFITTGIIVVLIVVAFAVLVHIFGWDWTGLVAFTSPTISPTKQYQRGKTLWDVLQLLIIPLALAIIAIFFNRSERKNEQRIASDNQQETILQSYLDRMSELLLEKNLHSSEPNTHVRNIARARTLTVLRKLNSDRKTSLLIFLLESELIEMNKIKGIIELEKADLSGIDLSDLVLPGLNLSGTDLRGAILDGAILIGADLSRADLRGADLSGVRLDDSDLNNAKLTNATLQVSDLQVSNLNEAELDHANLNRARLIGANLIGAKLRGADLSDAELYGADLRGADLSAAKLINAKLSGANLRGAKLIKADLSKANLSGAKLSDAELQARLSNIKLRKPKPTITEKGKITLTKSDLYGADLSEADLSGAIFNGTNLCGATYTKEQLAEVKSRHNLIQG